MNNLQSFSGQSKVNPLQHLSLDELAVESNRMRMDIIRMLHAAGSGHPGGSLSAMDVLTVLFARFVRRTPANALDPARDRFVLSKGHGVPALYAVMARIGLITPGELLTIRKLGSRLQGHPSNSSLPYVEASTGSLGQGLSIAQGMALAARLDRNDARVYALIGDGEAQEGQVWETMMSASKFRLDNLVAILDFNKGQIDGFTADVMNIEPVVDKAAAFGWDVQRIDGHDIRAIDAALNRTRERAGKPYFIVADTIKGKGVSFMEDNADWHGKAPNDREAAEALAELESLLKSQVPQTA